MGQPLLCTDGQAPFLPAWCRANSSRDCSVPGEAGYFSGGGVAQLVEHSVRNRKVGGSIPLGCRNADLANWLERATANREVAGSDPVFATPERMVTRLHTQVWMPYLGNPQVMPTHWGSRAKLGRGPIPPGRRRANLCLGLGKPLSFASTWRYPQWSLAQW